MSSNARSGRELSPEALGAVSGGLCLDWSRVAAASNMTRLTIPSFGARNGEALAEAFMGGPSFEHLQRDGIQSCVESPAAADEVVSSEAVVEAPLDMFAAPFDPSAGPF